jgi:hypothetical protein
MNDAKDSEGVKKVLLWLVLLLLIFGPPLILILIFTSL